MPAESVMSGRLPSQYARWVSRLPAVDTTLRAVRNASALGLYADSLAGSLMHTRVIYISHNSTYVRYKT